MKTIVLLILILFVAQSAKIVPVGGNELDATTSPGSELKMINVDTSEELLMDASGRLLQTSRYYDQYLFDAIHYFQIK